MQFKPFFPLVAVWIGASLAACLPSPQPNRPSGYLIAALESDPTHLDPRYATDANSVRIGGLIFNSLTRTDEHSRFRPDLAERWEAIDDLTYLFHLKKGTVDFIQNDIEPDMLPWLKKNSDASILTHQGTIFQYIGMNLDHPILKIPEVRQAIAYAIDREAIIRHLLKGLATPATGLLSPSHWAYEPSVPRFPHNPEEAKRLLDRAGFPDPDGDGPLPRFKLSFKTTTLDLRRRIAETFKEQLGRVGIELEVRTYEWGTFYGDIQKGNFHLYSLSWVGINDPDIYFTLFHSRSTPPSGNNRGRYRNPEVDRLLEEGRKSLNLAERKRTYARVQKILALDLPTIPLWWQKNVVVIKRNIAGFVPYPDGDLTSLKNVSFAPSHPSP